MRVKKTSSNCLFCIVRTFRHAWHGAAAAASIVSSTPPHLTSHTHARPSFPFVRNALDSFWKSDDTIAIAPALRLPKISIRLRASSYLVARDAIYPTLSRIDRKLHLPHTSHTHARSSSLSIRNARLIRFGRATTRWPLPRPSAFPGKHQA